MNNTQTSQGNSNKNQLLHQVIDEIITKYVPAARNNSNSLINNVSDKLNITINDTIVGSVISGLLHAMITHVKESHIYISAKELYGKMVEINVKDDNCYNTYAVALSLQDVVPLAEMIGGRLNITNQRQKITTISFSFPVDGEKTARSQKLRGAGLLDTPESCSLNSTSLPYNLLRRIDGQHYFFQFLIILILG